MNRQHISRNAVLLLSLLVSATVAGCGSPRRGEPLTGRTLHLSESGSVGELIFDRKCGPCHPGGEAGVGPALNNKPLPRFLMKLQVRRGLGAMPSFPESEVGSEDLERLIDYIVLLRRLRPVT